MLINFGKGTEEGKHAIFFLHAHGRGAREYRRCHDFPAARAADSCHVKIRRCVPCDGNEIRESSGIATGETLERDRDVNILWYGEEGEGERAR